MHVDFQNSNCGIVALFNAISSFNVSMDIHWEHGFTYKRPEPFYSDAYMALGIPQGISNVLGVYASEYPS